MQVFKVFVLGRITLKAFKALPGLAGSEQAPPPPPTSATGDLLQALSKCMAASASKDSVERGGCVCALECMGAHAQACLLNASLVCWHCIAASYNVTPLQSHHLVAPAAQTALTAAACPYTAPCAHFFISLRHSSEVLMHLTSRGRVQGELTRTHTCATHTHMCNTHICKHAIAQTHTTQTQLCIHTHMNAHTHDARKTRNTHVPGCVQCRPPAPWLHSHPPAWPCPLTRPS